MQESQDRIREGNILIAGFRGWKPFDSKEGMPGFCDSSGKTVMLGLYCPNEDWDELIEALKVAKEKIKKTDWSTTLEKEADKRLRAALNEVYNLNIENAHYCFVKFIEWFNQQKR